MNNAKEIYITKGEEVGTHYILMVNEDGSLTLNWYNNECKVSESEPIMTKKTNGCMMLECGDKNTFGLRKVIPFLDEKGVLDSRWDRIK